MPTESEWYDLIARGGQASIPVQSGQIVVSAEKVEDRRLIRATIVIYNARLEIEETHVVETAEFHLEGAKADRQWYWMDDAQSLKIYHRKQPGDRSHIHFITGRGYSIRPDGIRMSFERSEWRSALLK
jgi:hypothetical protein